MPLSHCLPSPHFWQTIAYGFRSLSTLLHLPNLIKHHHTELLRFPALPCCALLCPTSRLSLKAINPYGWPVLCTCPDRQPVKILPVPGPISNATSFRKASLISFLSLGYPHHFPSCSSCRHSDSISCYYKASPVLYLSTAGMNLILECRSVPETAHFLNCNKLLSFLLSSSSPTGMLYILRFHMILQAWWKAPQGQRKSAVTSLSGSSGLGLFLMTPCHIWDLGLTLALKVRAILSYSL